MLIMLAVYCGSVTAIVALALKSPGKGERQVAGYPTNDETFETR